MSLKLKLQEEQKTAMRNKDKLRLGTLRLLLSEIKQKEIDGKVELSDDEIISVVTKMVKQRKDSANQYKNADREDLATIELDEITVLSEFLPTQLTTQEIETLINDAITTSGASTPADMGKIMGILKPQVQGKADMGAISSIVRQKLA